MKISVRSGRRGRPLSIDPEQELNKLIQQTLPKAKERLSKFRSETSGVRDTAFLGSETDLPAFVESTIDVLADLREGAQISYESLREAKRAIKVAEQLASKQKRVYGRALEPALSEEYLRDLDRFSTKTGSTYMKRKNAQLRRMFTKLTPQQRQQFFFSRKYQDVRTQAGRYENIIAWAEAETGRKNMTDEEAWAYLRVRRLEDFGKDIGIFPA